VAGRLSSNSLPLLTTSLFCFLRDIPISCHASFVALRYVSLAHAWASETSVAISAIPSEPISHTALFQNNRVSLDRTGRGGGVNSHSANELFRLLVRANKNTYAAEKFRKNKREIARDIVQTIHEKGGKFLRLVKSIGNADNGVWEEVKNDRAIEKTMQALRETYSNISTDAPEPEGALWKSKSSTSPAAPTTCSHSLCPLYYYAPPYFAPPGPPPTTTSHVSDVSSAIAPQKTPNSSNYPPSSWVWQWVPVPVPPVQQPALASRPVSSKADSADTDVPAKLAPTGAKEVQQAPSNGQANRDGSSLSPTAVPTLKKSRPSSSSSPLTDRPEKRANLNERKA